MLMLDKAPARSGEDVRSSRLPGLWRLSGLEAFGSEYMLMLEIVSGRTLYMSGLIRCDNELSHFTLAPLGPLIPGRLLGLFFVGRSLMLWKPPSEFAISPCGLGVHPDGPCVVS